MAKRIMIQGTMSNAGKSLICAGLCRIFHQDGYKAAPFKSQNMALNSFITDDGLEMGRAQVVQAEAAKIRPRVEMNPILLKPTNDTGSQVIVNGKVWQDMSARDYFACKRRLVPQILEAYGKLEKEYDLIVIEGAGSPAEINLKENDIVNMGLAKMLDAPVLLVGDIDRGGVFAQLLGTLMLLEQEERERVKGLIINKFRGDKTILDPGIQMLEERCRVPVLGVTPYLHVDIEDEDSLTERFRKTGSGGKIDIAVIRTPRISNFTDFLALEHLEENGLESAILKEADQGTVIFGICGGYQMLGEELRDPDQVEEGGTMRGMGLLPLETVFTKEKTRTRVSGRFCHVDGALKSLEGKELEGYEIHMGVTRKRDGQEEQAAMSQIKDQVSGRRSMDGYSRGNVYGSYIHGIFDREGVAEEIAESLAKKKGVSLKEIKNKSLKDWKEEQYDLLADALREHLDMKAIYQILEEEE